MSFDGTDDLTDFGTSSIFNPDNITVEAWINPASGRPDNSMLISKYNSDWSTYFLGWRVYVWTDGHFDFSLSDGTYPQVSATTGANTLISDVWQHIAVTYDRTNIKMYRNGVLVNQTAQTRSMGGRTHIIYISPPGIGLKV